MSVNNMSFQDAATLLNDLVGQNSGMAQIAPIANLGDYISVGTTALKAGLDPLAIGISQMVGRTIFANRPYSGALRILERTDDEWGAITRKISAIDLAVVPESVYALVDGQHPDMFEVRKPKLFQTNFYGFDVWSDWVSVTRQQLKNAVLNPGDMGRLIDLVLTNQSDKMEMTREAFARLTLSNLIGALYALNENVVHLATEYADYVTAELPAGVTAAEFVQLRENYTDFIRWAYARIATISDLMVQRSARFHTLPSDGNNNALPLMRHTPKEDQRIFVYSGDIHQIGARVLAETFNSDMVSSKLPYTESLSYFQSIDDPQKIQIAPAYMAADGTITQGNAVTVDKIFAVIADRDALGYNLHDQSVDLSPYEARGKYYNYWYHEARRYWVDTTENAVLFLMD